MQLSLSLSTGLRRPRRKANHSAVSSAEHKNGWAYTCVSHVRSQRPYGPNLTLEELAVDTTGIAHPRSHDSVLPICHILMNIETDSRVKWLLENVSQCV